MKRSGNLVRVALLLPPEYLKSVGRLQKKYGSGFAFKNRNRALNTLIRKGLAVYGENPESPKAKG